MLDPLGALLITFFVMSFISIVGIIFMFLTKNEKIKKGIFYFLAIWGLVVAYCNIQTIPSYMTGSFVIAGALGALAIAAILINLCVKRENAFKVAQILAVISVTAGMIDTFMI